MLLLFMYFQLYSIQSNAQENLCSWNVHLYVERRRKSLRETLQVYVYLKPSHVQVEFVCQLMVENTPSTL